jgi:DNA repair protein RadC
LTRGLPVASGPLGLRVLDHVIVAEESTYSFADSGPPDELTLEAGLR